MNQFSVGKSMKYNCLSNCSEIVILTFHQLPVSHRSGLKLNKKSSFFSLFWEKNNRHWFGNDRKFSENHLWTRFIFVFVFCIGYTINTWYDRLTGNCKWLTFFTLSFLHWNRHISHNPEKSEKRALYKSLLWPTCTVVVFLSMLRAQELCVL